MILLPAIDIMNGKVVRLFKGQFDQVTEYGSDPLEMARHWEALGAQYLHVVDLDGAETGERRNAAVIKRIAREVRIPIETGGGIRSRDVLDDYLQSGVSRVVLGTRVVEDRSFLVDALRAWKERIAVSLDCKNGFVAQRGWAETSAIKGVDLAQELVALGLKFIIYTDIARDGALTGPNMDGLKDMLKLADVKIIASGGIKDLSDIKALVALKNPNLYGAITGRAIYEEKLDLEAALKLC